MSKQYSAEDVSAARRRFFINEELHTMIVINRSANLCTAYNHRQQKVCTYVYKDLANNMSKAYSVGNVAKIIGRSTDRLRHVLLEELTGYGQKSHETGIWYYSEKEIEEIRQYFANKHRGRPRKDGRVTPDPNTSTREESEALMGKRDFMYVKKGGKYIPIWKREVF